MNQSFTLPEISSGISKTSLLQLSEKTVDGILETGNVLQVAEVLSGLELFIKNVKGNEKYTKYLREEVEKYGKSLSLPNGTKIELAETGTKYDYSNTGDIVLQRMEQQAASANEAVKNRQDMLKTVSDKGLLLTDEETGETFTVYPPAKSSTSSYKVTLAK